MIKLTYTLALCIILFSIGNAQNTQLQSPNNKYHTFEHGLELLALEEYDAAHTIFSNFISTQTPDLQSIDAIYYQAYCKLKMNNPQGEIQIKNFVLQYPTHPKAVFANYDLGSYYFTSKNYPKAIDHLKQVNLTMLDEVNRLECNFKLGYSYMNIKDFDKAGQVFNRLKSTKNKYTYAASYYLGYVNYKNELFELAEQNLKKSS